VTWAPDYVTLAEAKADLRIDVGDVVDDVQIARYVTAASRAVDKFCHRQFGSTAGLEARTYEADSYDRASRRTYWAIDDLNTAVGLAVLSDGVARTDYTLWPRNAIQTGRVYERLSVPGAWTGDLVITATWGWTTVPVAVKLATSMQLARFGARRDSPFGVTGSPDAGGELRLLAKVDPDVEVALSGYRREWWAA
jgi:hypothetical protein